jgi:hypothetical protein
MGLAAMDPCGGGPVAADPMPCHVRLLPCAGGAIQPYPVILWLMQLGGPRAGAARSLGIGGATQSYSGRSCWMGPGHQACLLPQLLLLGHHVFQHSRQLWHHPVKVLLVLF